MSADARNTLMRRIALALIVCAVIGTEISYHFTLETRFNAIEEKLQQENTAVQEMQQSLDAMAAAKTETLSGLNKQLATLQSSFEPLGKNSKEQADSLATLRQQITALQQAQAGQQEAQKRLSDYIGQLEANVKKAHAEAELAKPAPAAPMVSAPAVNMPVAVPIPVAVPGPAPVPSASTSELLSSPGAVSHETPMAVEPRAQAVDPTQLTPASPNVGTGVVLRQADATPHIPHARTVGATVPSKS